jgi:hypothetical protein
MARRPRRRRRHRTIFDHDPDPARLLDELYFRVERGYLGLPLGQVATHATKRYTACYGALCLAQMLVELGVIESVPTLEVRGALYQDKRTSTEFPAAHALPCELAVVLPGRPPAGVPLHGLLRSPFTQTWVRRNIYGQTDRVHRLVNVADSSCEAGEDGMAAVLAEACEEVLRSGLQDRVVSRFGAPPLTRSVTGIFNTIVVEGFTGVAQQRFHDLQSELTDYEMSEMIRGHLLDRFGNFVAPQPTDTRKTSPDAAARAAAKITLCRVFRTYADPNLVDPAALDDMKGKIDALRMAERFA